MIKNIFFIVIGILVLCLIVLVASFNLFDAAPLKVERLNNVPLVNNAKPDCQVLIYYIPSNATMQDYLQIRKECSGKAEQTLASYER